MTDSCKYRVSAKALIKNKAGALLFVNENEGHGYELPGGGIENGETHVEALTRELEEELGVSPVSVSLKPTFSWIINGKVIWIIYEVGLDSAAEFLNTTHVAGSRYLSESDLEDYESNHIGYCSRTNVLDLISYLRIK